MVAIFFSASLCICICICIWWAVFVFVFDHIFAGVFVFVFETPERNVFVFVFVFDKTYLTPALVTIKSQSLYYVLSYCCPSVRSRGPYYKFSFMSQIIIQFQGL